MHVTPLHLLVGGLALFLARLLHHTLLGPLLLARRARQRNCGPVPVEPTRWPLGLDMVLAGLRADRAQRTPEFLTDRFDAMSSKGRKCHTFGVRLLGSANLVTAEPRNVQAVLAGQFADFAMGRARRTNLRRVLGRSIFAVDGPAWHAARDAVRPLFARDNIADLGLLERHVQALFACIEKTTTPPSPTGGSGPGKWTDPVGLAGLFPCLTIDSATELFLGHSTHALRARLRGEALRHDFPWAFARVQAVLSVRMRLRGLYWLYGNAELRCCMQILNAFVDDCMRRADLAASTEKTKKAKEEDAGDAEQDINRGAGTTRRPKYDYLDTLRRRCADEVEVREQVLGLLAAGRDTTASLLSWVWYCLVRHPRVFAKLRAVVLAEFGARPEDITFSQLKGCRYLQHVMSETLRLHSIVAFNSRMAVRDTTLPTGGGPDGTRPVFVPAGTEVNFSTHVMHRRKDLWGDDADQFVPERWESGLRPGWSYAPFNGGPRICIGQQFALTEAGYVIVRMLQRYEAVEGLDVDPSRDYCHFTIVAAPGTPNEGDEAVQCRLKVAA